ncbi:hypothetical protein ACJQWK_05128 [Exserohilum turcicum]|uniref:Uncharacterized protein n=1 Tax=Exserohilum turcicum (strain 28A) TaxID=671987 RepID=R0JXJ4_EXST2|nr:uncharacterized protein SETTUDRAFT_23438 [Exserohilum turcica Et28A]EOA82199.1 hypothetical protein SETTUDRAFT_23438 [Exserohilum turcica Et28A]
MISIFALDQVNKSNPAYAAYSAEDGEDWRYRGHLIIDHDGSQEFINGSPNKKSVYDAPRR